jgi:NADH-quinone oxidoreductase subunit E
VFGAGLCIPPNEVAFDILVEGSARFMTSQKTSEDLQKKFIAEVIAANEGKPGALLSILEAVQEKTPHKYLPQETLKYIAERADIPLSTIHSVATFYALFNLEPQGDNTVCICRGTACHTRGSRNLLHSLRLDLGLGVEDQSDGEKVAVTTPDNKFTVRTVACFGQCALAPVVEINHRISGHVNEHSLKREVKALSRENS